MFPSVAAMSPDFVPAVGRGGVSVQDGVALCQAQSAGVVDAVEGLLFVNYFPVDCIFFIFIFQRVDISAKSCAVSIFLVSEAGEVTLYPALQGGLA